MEYQRFHFYLLRNLGLRRDPKVYYIRLSLSSLLFSSYPTNTNFTPLTH